MTFNRQTGTFQSDRVDGVCGYVGRKRGILQEIWYLLSNPWFNNIASAQLQACWAASDLGEHVALGQSNKRQCWQHYCMQHARLGVVSAMRIVSEAQTFAFPGERAGWAGTWSPGGGPRGPWRAVLCTAGGITDPAPSRLRRYPLPRYGEAAAPLAHACVVAGMLDDGAQLRPAALIVRQMSCCWPSSAPPSDHAAAQQFARGARECHISCN